MEKIMLNFENWLVYRDRKLVETMSKEKMAEDDMDALKAAHHEKRKEDELEEKARSIKYLASIKKKIEGWVDAHNKGSKALKLIGAAMLNTSRTKSGIQSNLRRAYNHDLKDLKDLQQVFTHDSIMHHMTDVDVLHALHMILNTDFADQLVGLENDPIHHKTDHSHGEIGKKFAKFVVDQIKHAADDVLDALFGGHHEKDDESHPPLEDDSDMGSPDAGGSDMEAPDMEAPDMGDANTGDSDMFNADMSSANMGNANMGNANMGNANTGDSDMGGADMAASNVGDDNTGDSDMGGASSPPSDDNALMPPVGMATSPPQGRQPAPPAPPQGRQPAPPQGRQPAPPAPPMM
jgi:hypothetical protein